MKRHYFLHVMLLTLLAVVFLPKSFAEEYVVRQIYFYPSDREPSENIDATLDKVMVDVQKFYADEMQRHGFGRKTFRFETDAAGNQVRRHIRGKYTNADYWINRTRDVRNEAFNFKREQHAIYLVYYDVNHPDYSPGLSSGVASQSSSRLDGGNAQIWFFNIDDVTTFDSRDLFTTVAHELGHTFGLSHDFRDDQDIMSYGDVKSRLSYLAAEWLDVSRYFNTSQNTVAQHLTIQMLPPIFISPPNTIRLRFSISHTERIHQVQLQTNSLIHSGEESIIDHKSIKGYTNTVEFVTDKLSIENIKVSLYVIDEHGNSGGGFFPIDIPTLIPDSEPISIPDTNLAAAIRENLELAPGSTLTRLHMASLQKLGAQDKQITDLTGLEYATNLVGLYLSRNEITDISLLTELTQLTRLSLSENDISDISLLSRFTNLTSLSLDGNNISDISLLTGLTQLTRLSLSENDISDISPLAGLTRLKSLTLSGNNISDISLLSGFTHLMWLDLDSNDISDISPLAGLTQLTSLQLEWNNISDISPLTELTQLAYLSLTDNDISDISSLTELTQLANLYLYLGRNDISDISPLAGLTHLEVLQIEFNNISDISPLAGLTNLQRLVLIGNPIKDREPLLALLRKNPDMEIYLKDYDTPLPVTLSHFRAEHTEAGVLLKWRTESELDNAGFYIYRSQTKAGEFKVVNPTMIAGAGTTSERTEYSWTDTTAKPNVVYYYRIEDVSHAGVRKRLVTVRLRGLVSAAGKLTTLWGDLKTVK